MSEGAFLQDLAMLMAVAGSVSLLFARFKWPKVVGYIMAGVLLSRHTWGGSFLLDESSVQTAGQLGIVFLMFSMGLGLSTTQLKRVGNVAMPTALLDTVMMMWLGYTVGHRFLGWGTVPSLFLGAAICDSATTLLAKIIGEMGWEGRSFVRYALGTSVCEDIVCVGVMAVIAGVANGGGVDVSLAVRSMGGIAVFFIATFVFGLVLVPRLLTSVAKRGDDEALLLTLLGCCFFVTYVAYRLDYSFALGAFVVGVLGASSEARPRLERLVSPLRNMFAATFFVSVGLLVNPAECWAHLPAILGISALVVFGKFLNCTVGALACGTGLKTSVQMGMSLAQTGEFAYMAALLYVTITGDAEKPLYQVAVGVSLLTTILNPLMIKSSDRFGTWVEENCPARLAKALAAYRGAIERYRTSGADARRRSVRRQVLQLAVAAVLVFAASVGFSMLESRDWSRLSVFFESHKRLFFALAMNAVIATVLAIAVRIAKSMASS
ncbi:MAG: cation:proton antiporter, partial [Kiritimatiellae bacterium]|nr:cation:proton antiporter [Kiritimatiellia bacterium]